MIEFGKFSDGMSWTYKTYGEELKRVQETSNEYQTAIAAIERDNKGYYIELLVLALILPVIISLAVTFNIFIFVVSGVLLILMIICAVNLLKNRENKKQININLNYAISHWADLKMLRPKELERIKKCREVLKRYRAAMENTKVETTKEESENASP